MSVPSWLRTTSKTEFLWRLYRLNIRLGEIVTGHPKKYRATYGNVLLNSALSALINAQIANGIWMNTGTSDDDYKMRRRFLRAAKGYTETVATVAYIYLELTAKADGVKQEKILKQEEYIGLECGEIAKMIKGVMDSDKRIHNARFKEN